MPLILKKIFTLFLRIALSLLCSVATAKLNELPIHVESDTAEVDGLGGKVTHLGDVVMRQGSRAIQGDRLTLERDANGEVQLLVATGHPARYAGPLEEGKPILYGQADVIHYYPKEQRITLEGSAQLEQAQDIFQGPYIAYDIAKKHVLSQQKEGQRTTMILQSK